MSYNVYNRKNVNMSYVFSPNNMNILHIKKKVSYTTLYDIIDMVRLLYYVRTINVNIVWQNGG